MRKKNEFSVFQILTGMTILSQGKNSDFHDRISKQVSGKWKWFFNPNPKNVA
jgi:hypothetical protein